MRRPHIGLLIAVLAAIASIPVALASGATSSPPTVSTAPATNPTSSGATLNGSVNPNGQQTTYAFQWGPTSGYGHETPLGSAGSGTATVSESATLSGLDGGTTYHFRIIAMSPGGTSVGSDQSFTTTGTAPAPSPPPSATTGAATGVGQTGATVNGVVNPGAQSTTYYFEYGPTANYGFETSGQSAGNGTGSQAASTVLTGLAAGTPYHYRLVAVNPGGTALGSDQAFTTSAAPSGSYVGFLGREGFVSPGRIIGVEAGCFGGTNRCTGHVTMTHNGILIGQRDYNIAPNSGGFQNLQITRQGMQMLGGNYVFHLLAVTVKVTGTNGQNVTQVMHLARWVWH
jgi:hypothetical protein